MKSPKSIKEFNDIVNTAISTQFSYAYYKKVHSDRLHTIKYQLHNMGLISVIQSNSNEESSSEMIILTKAGRSYLNQLITVKKRRSKYRKNKRASMGLWVYKMNRGELKK